MDSKDHSTPQSGEPKNTSPMYFDSKNINPNNPTAGSNTTITKQSEKKVKKPPVHVGKKLGAFFKSLGSNILKFFKFVGKNIGAFFVFAFSGKHKRIAIPVTAVIVIVPVTLLILANTIWKGKSSTPYIDPADDVANYPLTGYLKENQDTFEKAFAILREGKTGSFDEAVRVLDDAIAAAADDQPKQFDLLIKKAVFYNTEADDPESAIDILSSIDLNSLDEDQKFLMTSNFAVFYEALGDESVAQRYRDKLYAVGGLTEGSPWYEVLKEHGELPSDMNAELTGNEVEEDNGNE